MAPVMKIITDEHCTDYSYPGHPERPERIASTVERLRKQTDLPIVWAKPLSVEDAVILRAHSPAHLAVSRRLETLMPTLLISLKLLITPELRSDLRSPLSKPPAPVRRFSA